MTMSLDGMRFEEVTPGSPEDPFTDQSKVVSSAPVASPAPAAEGTVPVQAEDGSKSPPAFQIQGATPTPAAVTPAPAMPAPAPASPDAAPLTLEKLLEDPSFKESITGLLKEETGKALRSQQSSYDKKINSLTEQLKATQEAAKKSEREAKLNSDDLTDAEREALRKHYEFEDKNALLDEREKEVEEMYRLILVAKLVDSHSQYGVSEEELLAIDDADAMEKFAADKELEFYRSGKTVTAQVPSRAVTAAGAEAVIEQPQVPAGALAPTDLGGGPTASVPVQLSTETGQDALASNLNKIPWETVRIRPN